MLETRTLKVGLRAEENENAPPIITADFVVFGDIYAMGWDCYETIDPHAFDDTINDDIRALFNHDTNIVLGRTKANTLTLSLDTYALRGKIYVNTEDAEAMNAYARVKRGDVDQCSFGFEILGEGKAQRPDGTWLFTLKKVRLHEVSIVTFPAYQATSASARSARQVDTWKQTRKARLSKCLNN